MLEILQFVFQSFWHFIGIVVMLVVIFECVEGVVKAFRRKE